MACRLHNQRAGGSDFMPLVYIVLTLVVAGVLMWLINTYIPMAGGIKTLLNAVVVIVLAVWVLQAFGIWHSVLNYRVPTSSQP
jgi:formate/nitrite transporter FocA (FNT family)